MFGIKGTSSMSHNSLVNEAQYKTTNTTSTLKTPSNENDPSVSDRTHDAQAAFKKIERLVKVRDRSIHEVIQRLQKENYEEDAISNAINKALRCGYLDDARFAEDENGFSRQRLDAILALENPTPERISQLLETPEPAYPTDVKSARTY